MVYATTTVNTRPRQHSEPCFSARCSRLVEPFFTPLGSYLEVVLIPPASIAAQYRANEPEHVADSPGSKVSGKSLQDSVDEESDTVAFVKRTLPVFAT